MIAEREKSERTSEKAALVAKLNWKFGCSKCDYRAYGVVCNAAKCTKQGPSKPRELNAWRRTCSCRQLCDGLTYGA